MKRKEQDHNVQRLMAEGFSKGKCTQALKDAGNNVGVALRNLERQRHAELQRAQQPRTAAEVVSASAGVGAAAAAATASGRPSTASSTAAYIPSLQRAKNVSSSFAVPAFSEAQQKLAKQRGRRHPCVVQFGSCQYGDYCLLKDMPGDVCVQHFQGCCIYGTACRHRHYVDGVDVRDVLREAQAQEEALLVLHKEGVSYRVIENEGGKVQVAEAILLTEQEDAGDDLARRQRQMRQPPPQPSDFNRIRGSAPSHTDPLWVCQTDGTDEEEGEGAASAMAHPTPFLDLARAAGATAASSTGKHTSGGAGHAAVAQAPASASPPFGQTTATRGPSKGVGRHPCVAQYGSCKFGDACTHADRDADVCVHFLNGRCRYDAGECRYRHESEDEFHAKLLARAGLHGGGGGGTASTDPTSRFPQSVEVTHSGARPLTQPQHRPKNRLQSAVGAGNTHANGNGRGTTASSPASASPLPSFEDLHALVAALSGPSTPDEWGGGADSDRSHHRPASAQPATGADSDTELRVFLGLMEVFPSIEPAVVLQALRVSNGDPIKATDMIGQLGVLTTEDVDNVAAALALAAAEEAHEREAAATAARDAAVQERSNALLTLVSLFPTAEPAAVEAMLTQQKGDFAGVYNTLLCVQESMVRSALWNGSTVSMSPADQLRVEKLRSMFPSLDGDVVRSAFCASDRNWVRATEALNELTKELLSLEAVERPATAAPAVVWHPHSPSSSSPSAAASPSAPPAPTAEETSEEAYAAYRAAEKEILGYGDWRQIREQAYLMNGQRIRVLGQAAAAFLGGDGRTAKVLSREGHRLAVEYNRLNRMAMLALEQERLRTDATSTLDLHGFHVAELHDVVVHRVEVCQRKRIGQLRIVVGEGRHSRRGFSSLYSALMEELRADAYLSAATKVQSIKVGHIDVAVRLPKQEY